MDLVDKVVLITGGRRIGACVARELANRGADVALCYNRSRAEAEQTAEAVRTVGRRALVVHADVSRPADCAALVGRTVEVLVEGVSPETEHLLEGRHHGMAPEVDGRLLINDGFAPAGSYVDVEITDAFASDLVGRIVGPAGAAGVVPASAA